MRMIRLLGTIVVGGGVCFPLLANAQFYSGSVFPIDHIWNTPVDTLPVDANSAAYIQTIGAQQTFHPDFGSGTWDGGPIGIPYITVQGNQPRVPVSFYYPDESDPGPYPIPSNAPIEGGENATGDRHILIIDHDNHTLYEIYDAWPNGDGSWSAGSGAIFDLNDYALRPAGWTSADAAGLPIFPGLVRYDDVASGEIRHALRFTAPQTRRAYVWPARHHASSLTGAQYPPMGQRFRLKADYDTSAFAPDVQVILRAMKRYGIILADNGSPWYVSGAPDARWNNDVLHQLDRLRGEDFEAVDCSALRIHPDSGRASTRAGWRTFAGFGDVWVADMPWLYHTEHNWLYAMSVTPQGVTLWDPVMQSAWWTSATRYPYLYRYVDGAWLWYQAPSTNPRWFLNLTTAAWESW